MQTFDEATKAKLLVVSAATISTCLFKRGLRNTVLQNVRPLNPATARMAGPAYTLRYIPAREDLDHMGVFDDRCHPQRKGIETCPPGSVFVIDSRGDARAASAGGILVARLWQRGVAGIVTDGGFRDSPEIAALPFPAYQQQPAAPVSLVAHHAADAEVPIACGGVAVFPGDIMVGDGEAVVVVPRHLATEIAAEAFEMTAYEDFVDEQVRAGRSTFGIYPASPESRAEFAAWRKARGR
jgi:regulator of RNase E activity RraA